MGKNKHTFIILITLLLLLTNCSCSKCISTVVMINVKYDSFSELRFRSVPISEYELYISEYDYITLNVPFVAVSNVPLQTWLF